jgi:hypothetical protein
LTDSRDPSKYFINYDLDLFQVFVAIDSYFVIKGYLVFFYFSLFFFWKLKWDKIVSNMEVCLRYIYIYYMDREEKVTYTKGVSSCILMCFRDRFIIILAASVPVLCDSSFLFYLRYINCKTIFIVIGFAI